MSAGRSILAIDPGSRQSAWLYMDLVGRPTLWAIEPNDAVLKRIRGGSFIGLRPGVIVIEQMASYGMSVGAEVFETVHWAGRFHEAAFNQAIRVEQLPRMRVKQAICHDSRAKDQNIRQALIDRFGGQVAGVGTTKARGPLYGISKDIWSALAIAVTWFEEGS